MPDGPHLVGISGGSGSGKTTLAHALSETLGDADVLPMDAYYRDLSHLSLEAREAWNFDAPDAFDWTAFVAALAELRRGRPVRRPIYDFTSHTRQADTAIVTPGRFVVVEGLLVLHDPEVRALLDTRVYLEIPQQTAIDRRVERDRRERGRRPDAVRRRVVRDVLPMYERWVQPTARWADVTLSGETPVGELVTEPSARLRSGPQSTS